MNLINITIRNYRSIEEISFAIENLDDGSKTYGLIGVNEAGKTTALKSMALRSGLTDTAGNKLPLKKDFKSRKSPIQVTYEYNLNQSEVKEVQALFQTEQIDSEDSTQVEKAPQVSTVKVNCIYSYETNSQLSYTYDFFDEKEQPIDNISTIEQVQNLILSKMHTPIFWTAEDRYLISQPINLAQFSSNPSEISIPLRNCFFLSGITNIQEAISSLAGDSTQLEWLEDELAKNVTEHINNIWKDHPIRITFKISDGVINFHVKDENTNEKAKTADQRSDGFKQFISFLLTVSAENKNNELNNSILLIDEPETHLHPQAQESLLEELIKITQNDRNNIAIFATHSNYMIDKELLDRNYKISKPQDSSQIKKFSKKKSTYASVNYDVFNILSTDYHNELYGRLHQTYQDVDSSDEKRAGIMNFDDNFFKQEKGLPQNKPYKGKKNSATLPTYIRNCIHHPEGDYTYTADELAESIETMIKFVS